MTEGAGGGTIVTTAIYHEQPEIALETLNIKFIKACLALIEIPQLSTQIHAMVDVTNGGLRGDLYESTKEARVGVKVYPDRVRSLVNAKVLQMLDSLKIDYLGVSLDALLIYCTPEAVDAIQDALMQQNVKVEQIGYVVPEPGVIFINSKGEESVVPRFRESAYTKIKEVVDESCASPKETEPKIQAAFRAAEEKKKNILDFIKSHR